jgi:hypothetical protein
MINPSYIKEKRYASFQLFLAVNIFGCFNGPPSREEFKTFFCDYEKFLSEP